MNVGAASRHFWPNSAIANGTTHIFHNLWVRFTCFKVKCKRSYIVQSSSNEIWNLDMDFNSGVCDLYSILVVLEVWRESEYWKSTSTAHTLTSVRPWCFLRSPVCCTEYWQQNSVHVTVCLGLNFTTRPHSTLRKIRGKI